MKIQTEVEEGLWKRARMAAIESGITVGEFVEVALRDRLGEDSPDKLVKLETPSVEVRGEK